MIKTKLKKYNIGPPIKIHCAQRFQQWPVGGFHSPFSSSQCFSSSPSKRERSREREIKVAKRFSPTIISLTISQFTHMWPWIELIANIYFIAFGFIIIKSDKVRYRARIIPQMMGNTSGIECWHIVLEEG